MDEEKSEDHEMEDELAQDIMRQVHELYTVGPDSLCRLASRVDLSILSPRKKVNVMIIGNHSAGKSSFINWYTEDTIQSTGVAIETQGFTVVTHGTKRTLAPIKGESTMMLFPYLKPLESKYQKPLLENLVTHVSTSDANDFPLVNFVDTPGLVDGDIAYPFDVNAVLTDMAAYVDLILVFLDPIGQALCSRTMEVVKALNLEHHGKMRYYLTKADTVPSEHEVMKLMVQITQNIKENIPNQHGLEIPMIWLPEKSSTGAKSVALNQIQDMCELFTTSIHQKVQDNLNQVEKDCQAIESKVMCLLGHYRVQRRAKSNREKMAWILLALAWTMPLLVTMYFILSFHSLVLPEFIQQTESIYDPIQYLGARIAPSNSIFGLVKILISSTVLFLVLSMVSKVSFPVRPNNVFQKPNHV